MFSAAEIKKQVSSACTAAMLPSAAYPRGHKKIMSLLCYLTGILHLCLAASLPSHSCDLESEQEVYALLNIALYETGGVEEQLEGENTISFFFLLSDSGLKFWKWEVGVLSLLKAPLVTASEGTSYLPSFFSLKCFLQDIAQQVTDAEGGEVVLGHENPQQLFPSSPSQACSKWDRRFVPL